ncbi:MAG TPA: four-carbon acid sugar kinase family protein [Verrucomicrobiae bacterium]
MAQGSLELLIIADDLTGSNDAGAQFAKRDIPAIVMVQPDLDELPAGYPVVVVNSESRHVAPAEAARRVRHIAKLGLRSGARHFFKKTDSTLRGNIAAELKALLDVTGVTQIPFVPAFPETGRTTRHGIHYLHGVPVAQTVFANDPLSPVRESEVAKVLRANANLRVNNANLDNVHLSSDAECVVFDCESRANLQALARAFAKKNQLRVLSGSAAFAEELPNILDLPKRPSAPIQLRGPLLCLNGSLNPKSLEQIAVANSQFHSIRLTPEQLFRGSTNIQYPPGTNVLIHSATSSRDLASYRTAATEIGISRSDLHRAAANSHGRIAQHALTGGEFKTLIVFGGDTLMGIARALNWSAFIPCGELEPGVTVARPKGSETCVISKAGGFGNAEVLKRIVGRTQSS